MEQPRETEEEMEKAVSEEEEEEDGEINKSKEKDDQNSPPPSPSSSPPPSTSSSPPPSPATPPPVTVAVTEEPSAQDDVVLVEDEVNNNSIKSTKSLAGRRTAGQKPPDLDTSVPVLDLPRDGDGMLCLPLDSAGLESISFCTSSPGADSTGSIMTTPPTPKLTAHELALLGSAHSFPDTPKIDSNTTPWFYKATWKSFLKSRGGAPRWARGKRPSKELFIWLFLCLLAIILLCVVVPVIWFKTRNNDDDDEGSGEVTIADSVWTTSSVFTS